MVSSSFKIAGLILAGGHARRMHGIDKGKMVVHGRTCLWWVYQSLKAQCCDVAVSAVSKGYGVRENIAQTLLDKVADIGPLSGVLEGLQWAQKKNYDALITVPVDTPFVPHDIVNRLLPWNSYASYGGRGHFLVALWSISTVHILRHFIEQCMMQKQKKKARVIEALKLISARSVDMSDDFLSDPFVNINTPDQLKFVNEEPLPQHVSRQVP